MGVEVGEIYVNLRADIAGFRTDLNKARADVGEFNSRIEQRFSAMEKRVSGAFRNLTRAAGVFGLSLGAGAIVSFAHNMLQAGGGIEELSQQLGIGTDALQAYQYGATQTGVSAEELEGGIRKLSQIIGDAASGSKTAIAAFDKLGVKLKDANGLRPTEDIFLDIADGLAAIEDPALRASAAVDVMGRGGQRLLPMLAGGSAGLDNIAEAARRAGVVLTRDMIHKMDDASDAIDANIFIAEKWFQVWLADNLPAIRREIEGDIQLIKDLSNWLQHVKDVAAHGPTGESGKTLLEEHLDRLTGHPEAINPQVSILLGQMDEMTASLTEAQGKLAAALEDNRAPIEVEDARDRVNALTAALGVLQAKLDEFKAAGPITITLGAPAIDPFIVREQELGAADIFREKTTGTSQFKGTDTGGADKIKGVIDALKLKIDNLARNNEEVERYTALAQAQVTADSKVGQQITALVHSYHELNQSKQSALEMATLHAAQAAEEDDARAAAHERAQQLIQDYAEIGPRMDREFADRQRLIAALMEGGHAYRVEAQYQEIANEARAAGHALIGQEIEDARRRAEAIVAQNEGLQTVQNQVDMFRQGTEDVIDGVSGFMRDFWKDAGDGAEKFWDVVNRVLDQLWDALWELAVTNPLKNLFLGGDSSGGLLPVIGDVVGNLFGSTPTSAGGGSNTNTAQHRAGGGKMKARSLYEINERGQEFFAPGMDGWMIPHGAEGGGGDSGVIVQVFDQRNGGEPVTTQQDKTIDGKRRVRVFIRDAVRDMLAEGDLDRTLMATHGLRRRGRIA